MPASADRRIDNAKSHSQFEKHSVLLGPSSLPLRSRDRSPSRMGVWSRWSGGSWLLQIRLTPTHRPPRIHNKGPTSPRARPFAWLPPSSEGRQGRFGDVSATSAQCVLWKGAPACRPNAGGQYSRGTATGQRGTRCTQHDYWIFGVIESPGAQVTPGSQKIDCPENAAFGSDRGQNVLSGKPLH